jgi:hypothetical protein
MNEKHRKISIMMNRSIRGKMPTTATGADWAKYHNSFTKSTITARDFAADVYRGYSFCPVYDGRRKQENFSEAWHIAFDFDSNGIDDLRRALWVNYFLSFAYSTPSSTADAPKCRAVFIFDQPIQSAESYRELYHALAWWFGRDGLETDPACKDVIRLYYGSPKCQLWDNWSILPRAAQRNMIDAYRRENAGQPRQTAPQWTGPARTADEQKIREALRYIPSWGDYGDWLTVLMAVHSQYPNEQGIGICEAWSPGKTGEVASKFASFEQGGQNNVNIGSLFKLAKDYGYQPVAAPITKSGGRLSHKEKLSALMRA